MVLDQHEKAVRCNTRAAASTPCRIAIKRSIQGSRAASGYDPLLFNKLVLAVVNLRRRAAVCKARRRRECSTTQRVAPHSTNESARESSGPRTSHVWNPKAALMMSGNWSASMAESSKGPGMLRDDHSKARRRTPGEFRRLAVCEGFSGAGASAEDSLALSAARIRRRIHQLALGCTGVTRS